MRTLGTVAISVWTLLQCLTIQPCVAALKSQTPHLYFFSKEPPAIFTFTLPMTSLDGLSSYLKKLSLSTNGYQATRDRSRSCLLSTKRCSLPMVVCLLSR